MRDVTGADRGQNERSGGPIRSESGFQWRVASGHVRKMDQSERFKPAFFMVGISVGIRNLDKKERTQNVI